MATIKVSNQTQLLSALKVAKGGDTILLANGNYGEVTLKNDFSSAVTIQAETSQGATFTKISVSGASNLTFDGLKLATSFSALDSSGITLTDTTAKGTLYFRDVNGLVVDHATSTGGQYGILLNSVQNFSVTNSTFGKVTEDVMRITGNSYNGVVENNVLADTVAQAPTHPDLLQFFAANGYTPHDIVIRGNVLYDNPSTGAVIAQGIFMSDPSTGGYKNILIEDNLINVNSPNSIYINGGQQNVVVRHNTLIPGSGDGGAIIRLAEKSGMNNAGTTVEGNIAKLVVDETNASTFLHNYIYGRNADLSSLFHGTNGSTWENFVPVAGSDIDFGTGYGAQARLKALLLEYYGKTPIDLSGAPATPSDGQPTSAESVYHLDNSYEMTGVKKTVVALANDPALSIDTGSIGLTFNADTVAGARGIVSKGAAGYDDDFSVWISDGKLILCAENDTGAQVRISTTGIKANTDYDLLITFDESKIKVWLNDKQVGEATFDLDLSGNSEYLVLGGINGQSTRGTIDKVSTFFDGTISDLSVYSSVLTPAEFTLLEEQRHAHDLVTY
jgi:hypothetical protein